MTTIIFGRVQRIRRRHRWVLQRVAVLNWLRLCGPDDFDSVRCYVKLHHIIVVTTLTLAIIRGSLKQAELCRCQPARCPCQSAAQQVCQGDLRSS